MNTDHFVQKAPGAADGCDVVRAVHVGLTKKVISLPAAFVF